MSLSLPGEAPSRPRLLEMPHLAQNPQTGSEPPAMGSGGQSPPAPHAIAIAVVVGLCSLGCATPSPRLPRTRRVPATVIAAAHAQTTRADRRPTARPDEGSAFVARALRDGGLRFGTDGSTRALWEYLRLAHETVDPARARAGDVLFFDTRATAGTPDCDDATDHAGIVESIEPDGRLVFIEARAGEVRRSVVDPANPNLRRTDRGEIANTFLRPMRVDDPPSTRYFAAQMLCGIARVTP